MNMPPAFNAPAFGAPSASARDRLIEAAIDLFNRHGFHATGVDRIVAVAKVAKKTLYAHFPSKEDLILAALAKKRTAFAERFFAARGASPGINEGTSDPKQSLLGLFDMAKSWFDDPDFYGCIFINAAVEYSDPDHPINGSARQFKTLLRAYAREHAVSGGAGDPDHLADQIALLFEGATTVAQVSDRPDAAVTAKQIAAQLIDEAFRK